ncbi:hypothetical protein [Catellicoccus marimammalium]|uniref:Uncharacterized protein n=1 Tax=Catellicoccus marimammalium M35/04/3 TaxID=1234409 RepID=K8ZCQ2_9ENTE|nr:hypothetical protein [Catellicoccus marimammalium]EKU27832.1 hypothetical protein C683_0297 [Catellicoccus marimammalium M35/04/3]
MNHYMFPIIELALFIVLIIANIILIFRDYKRRLLINEEKEKKVSLIPNTINIILIVVGIGLSIYEIYLIYSQLHS